MLTYTLGNVPTPMLPPGGTMPPPPAGGGVIVPGRQSSSNALVGFDPVYGLLLVAAQLRADVAQQAANHGWSQTAFYNQTMQRVMTMSPPFTMPMLPPGALQNPQLSPYARALTAIAQLASTHGLNGPQLWGLFKNVMSAIPPM